MPISKSVQALQKRHREQFPYRSAEKWRSHVKVAKIREQLHKCVFGEIELTTQQLAAAKILLDKCIPNLSSVEHSGSVEQRHVTEYSDAELIAIIAENNERDRRERSVDPQAGAYLTAEVHGVHDSELEGGEDPPRYQ